MDVIGPTVTKFALEAPNDGHLPQGSSEALLVLILKVDHPSNITQFWPISLRNVTYKLVIKMVANRLKEVMGELISQNQ